MADVIAVVSKAVFEPEMKSARLAPGVVWQTKAYVSQNKGLAPLAEGGRLFLVTVRPPDEQLWLVAVLESPKSNGTQWSAATNVVPVRDVSAIKKSLKFANGQGLPDKVGVLGMSLQTPRVLAAGDIALLLGKADPSPVPANEPAPAPEKPKKKPAKKAKAASEPPPAEPKPPPPAAPAGPAPTSFDEVAAAWRRTRHARFRAVAGALSALEPPRPPLGGSNKKADVQEWLDVERANDPQDTPRLLASMTKSNSLIATERVALIARRDDPRVITALLEVCETAPYTASSTRHFWQAAVRALGASNDAGAGAKMVEIAKRYKLISDTAQGQTITRDLYKAASEMKPSAPLSEADRKALEALEKKLGITPPAEAAPKTESTKNAESLFEAITAAPDDDDARLIYADVLSEKGDDRGEFIVLQVERAAGRGSAERADLEREKFIKTKRFKEFQLPLAAAADQVIFERGFPVEVRLQANGLSTIIDAPEWGTVRKITLLHAPSAKTVIELLTKGNLPNLTDAGTLSIHMLSKLKTSTFPWTALRVHADGLTAEHLSRFPKLEVLDLSSKDYTPTPFDPKVLAAVPNLTELTFSGNVFSSAPIAIPDFPKLRKLGLGQGMTNVNIDIGPHTFRDPAQLEEIALWGSVQRVGPWLEAMPNVKRVIMHTSNNASDAIAIMDKYPQVEVLECGRYMNARRTRFERTPEGLQLVLTPNDQLYAQMNDEAATNLQELYPLGVRKLVIWPLKPRHQMAPVDPAVIQRITDAWGPNNVTVRELL